MLYYVEVDVDGWASGGEVGFALVADNRPPLEPGMCETGGTYPSALPAPLVRAAEGCLRAVLAAIEAASGGRYHGAFHFEAIVNPATGVATPVEWNCRVGGAEHSRAEHALSPSRVHDTLSQVPSAPRASRP
jgi:hypothetical protein